jgi:hypothetical protein
MIIVKKSCLKGCYLTYLHQLASKLMNAMQMHFLFIQLFVQKIFQGYASKNGFHPIL